MEYSIKRVSGKDGMAVMIYFKMIMMVMAMIY
jgi:hypothetical protein